MKYTELPTNPGRYIDRVGDEWTLNENWEWKCRETCDGGSFRYVDAVPDDDKQTDADDRMLSIDNIDDLKPGDIVHFRDDPTGYKFMARCDGHRIRVSLHGGVFEWLCDTMSGDVIVDVKYFDHAVRKIEEPEWPNTTDNDIHVYQGADGAKYLYMPLYDCDGTPWHQLPYCGDNGWHNAEDMTKCYPTALPLKELKLVQEEEES